MLVAAAALSALLTRTADFFPAKITVTETSSASVRSVLGIHSHCVGNRKKYETVLRELAQQDLARHSCHCFPLQKNEVVSRHAQEWLTDIVLKKPLPMRFIPLGPPISRVGDVNVVEILAVGKTNFPKFSVLWIATKSSYPRFTALSLPWNPFRSDSGECALDAPEPNAVP